MKYDFITFQDTLYVIYRRMRETQVKPGAIEFILPFWHCDIALKKEEWVYFCRKVEEAQIVTE
jgi:hypothetical protein